MIKADIKEYRPNLRPHDRDPLHALAAELGFIVTRASRYEGDPSVRDFLHALAIAYTTDTAAVIAALRGIGVTNPHPKPTPHHTTKKKKKNKKTKKNK